MKNVLIAVIALSSVSAFAGESHKCESKAYEEIMSSQTVKSKLETLLADAQENLEKITEISTAAHVLAEKACN